MITYTCIIKCILQDIFFVTLVEQTGFDQLLNRFLSLVTLSPIILETVIKFKFKKCLWKNIMEPFQFRNLLFSTLLSRSMKHSFDKWIASVKHKTDITSISKSVWNNKNCQHGERNKYLVPRELKPPRVGWIFKYTCKWCEINQYCKTKWNEFKLCQDVRCDYLYM